MANAAGTPRLNLSAAIVQKGEIASPEKYTEHRDITPRPTQSPRMESRAQDSTPQHARQRTGLAKKLEISFAESSLKNSPQLSELASTYPDPTDAIAPVSAPPAASAESPAANSPGRQKKALTREFPSLRARVISSPRSTARATPQHPVSVDMQSARPSITPSEEASGSQRSPVKLPKSSRNALADAKSKIEDLVSPSARIKHLFEDIHWATLTNSHESTQREVRFGPATIQADSPTRADAKRKAIDEPEDRPKKRLKFDDELYSRGEESLLQDENENAEAQSQHIGKIDQLSKELKEWEALPRVNTTRGAKAEKVSAPNEQGHYPFKITRMGKAILRARGADRPWFTQVASQSGSEALKTTLNKLRDANPGKIDADAFNFLQELFSLLPAGAIAGTEVFAKGLTRSIRELSLTDLQWNRIEALHDGFDSLDTSTDPQGFAEFKKLLNRIITMTKMPKKSGAEDAES